MEILLNICTTYSTIEELCWKAHYTCYKYVNRILSVSISFLSVSAYRIIVDKLTKFSFLIYLHIIKGSTVQQWSFSFQNITESASPFLLEKWKFYQLQAKQKDNDCKLATCACKLMKSLKSHTSNGTKQVPLVCPGVLLASSWNFPNWILSPSFNSTSAFAPPAAAMTLLHVGIFSFSLPVPVIWSACTWVFTEKWKDYI